MDTIIKLTRRADVRLRGSEVGTRKVVDAALISNSRTSPFPLIVVEVGFMQLEDLFDCAERLFQGTYREIQLVILVKIEEKNRHQGRESPGGYCIMAWIHFMIWINRTL